VPESDNRKDRVPGSDNRRNRMPGSDNRRDRVPGSVLLVNYAEPPLYVHLCK